MEFITKRFHRFRHWFTLNWRAGRRELLLNGAASLLWLYILLSTSLSTIVNGDHPNYMLLGALILMMVFRSLAIFRPKESIEETKYRERRKVTTALVIDEIIECLGAPSECSNEKINSIRRDILICITENVRQFRKDFVGTKIYANLLVEHDEHNICVLVRASPRKHGKVHSKRDLSCASIFETGEIVVNGNAKKATSRNISYNSFVGYPVTDIEGNILAVVTIDSVERNHFDGEFQALETSLRPYLRTMALTFMLRGGGS